MKRYQQNLTATGKEARSERNLRKLLNLNYTLLTNKTYSSGQYDLPKLICDTHVLPDYLADYCHPTDYHMTRNTAVVFFQYDIEIDGRNSLYSAIYYNDTKLLEKFKARFAGVKFFFSPDYSQFGDVDLIENLYRLKKSRIVSLWLTMEMGAVVIPIITYPTIDMLDIFLAGLEDCKVVAFSTKGYVRNRIEKRILLEAVKYTVDKLDLRAIVVYDVCGDNKAVDEIFSYAREKGIEIVVPLNTMKIRNAHRKKVG